MLIDKHLPSFTFQTIHYLHINASASRTYASLRTADFRCSFIVRLLLFLRGLPSSLRHITRSNGGHRLDLDDVLRWGFILLEDTNHEVVLGLVGKFWTLSGSIQRMQPAAFRDFDSSGFAKAAWNFHLKEEHNGSTVLSTETRVLCTDEKSRKKFQSYWFIVRPFSGLIRREALRIIKRNAEHEQRVHVSNNLSRTG